MVDYVNPFGGYAQGYGQGVQLEDELQQNARRARQADWESKYINPITLDTAQRANELGAYRLPYEKAATNDASIESRAGAQDKALDTATRYALALRDPSMLNAAGRSAIQGYANRPDDVLLRGADYERNLGMSNAEAMQAQKEAYASYMYGRNPTAEAVATIRSNPSAAAQQPGPAGRLFPQAPAPTAPSVAPGATPAQPIDSESPGVNPQGSMTPFHQLDPLHQAHILHYTSQLTGHPIDAVAQHIASQYNPVSAATAPTTNFATT
jgi:hypothetical protein